MLICGLQKLSLVDWPGKAAATVFTGGCDFACPFCHNSGLIGRDAVKQRIPEEEVYAYLDKRKKLLDGICVSGGEPLMHPDLSALLEKIKSYGYPVKLDTNGSYPDRLIAAVRAGLVDYVAMDVKNSPERYSLTCGVPADLDAVRKSAAFLMSGAVDFEFRTTVVPELHRIADMEDIGRWIGGKEKYFLQRFTNSENVLQKVFTEPSASDMKRYLDAVRPFLPNAALRGV